MNPICSHRLHATRARSMLFCSLGIEWRFRLGRRSRVIIAAERCGGYIRLARARVVGSSRRFSAAQRRSGRVMRRGTIACKSRARIRTHGRRRRARRGQFAPTGYRRAGTGRRPAARSPIPIRTDSTVATMVAADVRAGEDGLGVHGDLLAVMFRLERSGAAGTYFPAGRGASVL